MDHFKYNLHTRLAGELAVRSLSKKAAQYYSGTDPLTVFEYDNADGEKRYAYSYANNPYADKEMDSDLTFEELQEAFEEMQSENERLEEPEKDAPYVSTPAERQEYLNKIEDMTKQLTEKEKEQLSSFFPTMVTSPVFHTDPRVRAVKEKYGLSWSEMRGITLKLSGRADLKSDTFEIYGPDRKTSRHGNEKSSAPERECLM